MNFVEQQREDDRSREVYNQIQHADCDGIANQTSGIRTGEEGDKVLKSNPFTPEDAFCRREILESHQQADHRGVVEHRKEREDHNQQYINQFVAADIKEQVMGYCPDAAPDDIAACYRAESSGPDLCSFGTRFHLISSSCFYDVVSDPITVESGIG